MGLSFTAIGVGVMVWGIALTVFHFSQDGGSRPATSSHPRLVPCGPPDGSRLPQRLPLQLTREELKQAAEMATIKKKVEGLTACVYSNRC